MMVSNCVTGGRGLIVAFTPASLPMSHDVTLSSSWQHSASWRDAGALLVTTTVTAFNKDCTSLSNYTWLKNGQKTRFPFAMNKKAVAMQWIPLKMSCNPSF